MEIRFCKVKHKPPESYGDCIKACIDTILDRDDCPHSFCDSLTGEQSWKIIRDWMIPLGFAPFVTVLDEEYTLEDVFKFMEMNNPESVYILIGGTGSGDHAVVCKGNKMAHNPAWTYLPVNKPHSEGHWLIVVIGKI